MADNDTGTGVLSAGDTPPQPPVSTDDSGTKLTAYGYPGDSTPDSASEAGQGDAGWTKRGGGHLVPEYSAALTVSQRKEFFPELPDATSTGLEFTFKGKTYRDDDTAPEADNRVDVYDPSHPPDRMALSTTSRPYKDWQGTPPIDQWRNDYPELADYSDEQVLDAVKPKIAPDMSDKAFKSAAYSPQGGEIYQQNKDSRTPIAQARIDFPQFKQLDNRQFTKKIYGLLTQAGKIDPSQVDEAAFTAKMSPPNNVMTWLGNFFASSTSDDPWNDVLNDYKKFFQQAQGTMQQGAAGLYSIPQGLNDLGRSPMEIADQVAKMAGIDSNIQKGYDDFSRRYLNDPFDDFFRKSLQFLNHASEIQKQAAQANFQKSADLNPVLKIGASIAGSVPEMAATYGFGAEAKGATKAEQVGRMLWASLVQASGEQGKDLDSANKSHFMNQYRSGMSAALQTLLFNSPYGKLATGLWNSLLGANYGDMQKWIKGEPSNIGDDIVETVVNFGLGYAWGHDGVSEAAKSDFDAAETARLKGETAEAKERFDRAFSVMSEEEANQHAQNYIMLLDVLSDNRLDSGDILHLRQHRALTPETLKAQIDNAERGTPEQIAKKMANIKPAQSVSVWLPSIESQQPAEYHPWNKPFLESSFADAMTGGSERTVGPLTKSDVNRFTNKVYFNRDKFNKINRQRGAILNPGILIAEGIQNAKKAVEESPVGDVLRGISDFGHGIRIATNIQHLGPKAEEAAAQIGQLQTWSAHDTASFGNQLFKQQSDDRFLNDMDTSKKRSAFYWKYSKEQQRAMIFAHEKGKLSGDPVADEIRRVHKIGYDQMAQEENELGATFELNNNYIVHAIKDRDKRQAFVQRMSVKYADPNFMHARELDSLEQAAVLGHEFETNQEELFQGRVFDHNLVKMKINALDMFEAEGNAYKTGTEDIPKDVKDNWTKIRSPKRKPGTNIGTTYYVHPEKAAVMARAWDPMFNNRLEGRLADFTLGNFIRALKGVKAFTTPIRLWSAAHLAHIPAIRGGSRFAHVIRDTTFENRDATVGDWFKALSDVPTSGIQQVVRDVKQYGNLINALQGDAEAMENLSDIDRDNAVQLLDGAFSPGFNHDQHAAAVKYFNSILPAKLKQSGQWDTFTKFGHQLASHVDFQGYTFGHIIPSVKAAHAVERIAELFKEHPEFRDEKNNLQRLMALRKIMRQTDLKFGEMNYDNMFMVKWLKGLGVGTFLSFAWQLGLVDYAGGLVDTGKNSVHFAKVLTQTRKMGPASRAFLQDRMVTSYLYTGIAMTTGAMITYLNMRTKPGGDQHKFEFRDFFFPWAGHNANGGDNRYRTMTFPGELYSIAHDVMEHGSVGGAEHVIGNKYNSTISAIVQAMQNTNFIGQKISDADALTLQGAWDRTGYVLSQSFQPIGTEQYAAPFQQAAQGKPAAQVASSAQDAVAAFFGFNKAPLWTGRTDLANKILAFKRNEKGVTEGQSTAIQKQWDLQDKMKDAANNKDVPALKALMQEAAKSGMSIKSIENTIKNRAVSSDKLAFHSISSAGQLELLKTMSYDQQKTYWQYADRTAKEQFLKWRHNEHTRQPANP